MGSFTPRPLSPGKRVRGTHWIGGWVGFRAGLEVVAKREISCACRGSNTVFCELSHFAELSAIIIIIIIISNAVPLYAM
jgi:hypothetical protein